MVLCSRGAPVILGRYSMKKDLCDGIIVMALRLLDFDGIRSTNGVQGIDAKED